jgi:hypothetical protein
MIKEHGGIVETEIHPAGHGIKSPPIQKICDFPFGHLKLINRFSSPSVPIFSSIPIFFYILYFF